MAGYVRGYLPGDEHELATRLRKADRDEIEAACGMDPVDALRVGAEASVPALSIIDDDWTEGEVVGMFGCVPESDGGRVWLLGSDALVTGTLKWQFLRECRRYVDAFPYSLLYNVIDARNTVHIRWLKWMGFTFIGEPTLLGPQSLPFLKFVRIQPYVHGATK